MYVKMSNKIINCFLPVIYDNLGPHLDDVQCPVRERNLISGVGQCRVNSLPNSP